MFEQQLRVIDCHIYENLDEDGEPLIWKEVGKVILFFFHLSLHIALKVGLSNYLQVLLFLILLFRYFFQLKKKKKSYLFISLSK